MMCVAIALEKYANTNKANEMLCKVKAIIECA